MTKQETIEIKVQPRNTGKHISRGLRKDKQVPAIIYGPKIDNVNLSISEIDAVRYSAHQFDNTIFTLKSDDSKLNSLKVLKKDMTVHPVSRRPTHIDFYALDMDSEVRVYVELKFVGRPIGALEGGIVQEIHRDVEVECPANDIPKSFEINIEKLDLGDVLHVSDIATPSGVKMITSLDEAIVTVAQPKEEEAATAEATAGEAAPAGEAAAAPADAAKAEKK